MTMGHVIDWEAYDYRSSKIKNQAMLISKLCECEVAEELDPEYGGEVITLAVAGICVDLITTTDLLISSYPETVIFQLVLNKKFSLRPELHASNSGLNRVRAIDA